MKLALLGGTPVRSTPFPRYCTIGAEEKKAVERVLDSGKLSGFLGSWHENFYGGPEVRALEAEWSAFFGVKHAIAVNSATSGLYAAVGATGVSEGDEIIVSPYSMCASATAPLVYNAIPVFADIEPDHFCLDPEAIRSRINSRTKAIIVVDIFGAPYNRDSVNQIAKEHGLIVIEDAAQAPYARYKGQLTGTLGDIGIFSLNYHKHIHCGEGGIVTTNNDEWAERIRLIRNHAEAVLARKGDNGAPNMIGFNYRMTEIEASIVRCQLRKLPTLVKERRENCLYLNQQLSTIPCLKPPHERPECEHAYYVHTIRFDAHLAGVSRERFIEALNAELAPIEGREKDGLIREAYPLPLYMLPLYQNQRGYGTQGLPWSLMSSSRDSLYKKGICPTCEYISGSSGIMHEHMTPPFSRNDLDDVVRAFVKVYECRSELQK